MCAWVWVWASSYLQAGDFDQYYSSFVACGGEREKEEALLGAHVVGDWTRGLNEYALRESESIRALAGTAAVAAGVDSFLASQPATPLPVPAQVLFDGP